MSSHSKDAFTINRLLTTDSRRLNTSEKPSSEDLSFEEPQNARFCIICCEATDETQQISETVNRWNLPDVRSLLVSSNLTTPPINGHRHHLPSSDAIAVARSEYAIFVTPAQQPCADVKVSPLGKVCGEYGASHLSCDNVPSLLLAAVHNHHGQSPQSWWIQMPTAKTKAQKIELAQQKSVAQTLDKIGVFLRNYQTTAVPTANQQKKAAATKELAANKRDRLAF